MARYTGPKSKISRKYGEPIFGDTKALEKKPHPPGQHGRGRRRKKSEYAIQLAEKQKAKYLYGILEKQFRNMFDKASRKDGVTGENLLQLLAMNFCKDLFRNLRHIHNKNLVIAFIFKVFISECFHDLILQVFHS